METNDAISLEGDLGHRCALPQPPGRCALPQPPGDKWLSPHWLWLGLPFVLIVVLGGMLPPVDFDVREYHLQAPKEFFQQGRITFLPHNVYANMAMGSEMLCLLAMAITGDWWLGALAGKTVMAAMAPLTALCLLAAGRRFFSPAAGIVAALVYISIPWITSISSGGLVEGASAYYLLTSIYALLLWQGVDFDKDESESAAAKSMANSPGRKAGVSRAERKRKSTQRNSQREEPRPSGRGYAFLLLAGYLAGGAVSCKYPAVLFVAVPLTAWVVLATARSSATQKRRLLRVSQCVGVFLLATLLGCGLWFGKNWVLAGNPAYPLLYGVFGGETRTAEKHEQWSRAHRPRDFSPPVLGDDLSKVAWRSEWLSPLVMPLAVLALLGHRRQRRLVLALWIYFGFVIAAWWLLTHRIDRFWIPALSIVALLAGAGACYRTERWWRRLVVAMLLAGLGANLLVAAAGYNHYFVSLRRLRDDPQRVDPWHGYFNRTARDGRVLFVGDAQVFDVEVPVLYNTCFDDSVFERMVNDRTPEEVGEELAARGISHVYVHWGELERYRRTYGFANHPEADEFRKYVARTTRMLVERGVLEPLPDIEGHSGRGYRVKGRMKDEG